MTDPVWTKRALKKPLLRATAIVGAALLIPLAVYFYATKTPEWMKHRPQAGATESDVIQWCRTNRLGEGSGDLADDLSVNTGERIVGAVRILNADGVYTTRFLSNRSVTLYFYFSQDDHLLRTEETFFDDP